MTQIGEYRSHIKPSLAATAICIAIVVGVTAVSGRELTFVVDALFILALSLFALVVVLTRPSVSRRRAIQDVETADEGPKPDHNLPNAYDPTAQFRWGIRFGLIGTSLLVTALAVQYGVL